MAKTRNGRIITNGNIVDIMLPNRYHTFNYSLYDTALITPKGENKVLFVDDTTQIIHPAQTRLSGTKALLGSIEGFESYNWSASNPSSYKLVKKEFDILSKVDLVYAHPDLENILSQLSISSLTPFYNASKFGLETTGEEVMMEVAKIKYRQTGRTATFEKPVRINGDYYLLEVKGVNFGNQQIELYGETTSHGEAGGILLKKRMEQSVKILNALNSKGYGNVILVAAFQIPEIRQFDYQPIGAYVRAVKASPTIAHYVDVLPTIAKTLNLSKEDFIKSVIRDGTEDISFIWKHGFAHEGIFHEQNLRFGSICDFTDSNNVVVSGFRGIVQDAATFVFSCQNLVNLLFDKNDQTNNYLLARGIISEAINDQLELGIPANFGIATLAAKMYGMQKDLGLTNPHEETRVEHIIELDTNRLVHKGADSLDSFSKFEMSTKPLSIDELM